MATQFSCKICLRNADKFAKNAGKGSIVNRCGFMPVRFVICLLNIMVFSIRWTKRSLQQSAYFGACFLMLLGAALVVGSGCYEGRLLKDSSSFVIGLLLLIFFFICSLCSFATVYTTITFTCLFIFLLFVSITNAVLIWNKLDYSADAGVIRTLIITSHSCIFFGYLACAVLSQRYHWLIYKVGSSQKLCCITRCGGRCGFCLSCCICCSSRDTRLNYNEVTLYHMTRIGSALAILESQEMRSGEAGVAGGGIYFALKPPSCERKAQVGANEEPVMLKATVRLGKILEVPNEGIEGFITGFNYNTTCDEMRAFLQQIQHDSVWIRRKRPELVVYHADQVRDIKPVHY